MQSQSMHTPPFPFMSKRKLPPSPEIRRHHPTSPTPLPKPASSSSSSLMSARHRSSASSNSSPLLSMSIDDSKRPPFWSQQGMVPFVDWITTPANHAALHKRRNSTSLSPSSSSSGESMSQALERLRAYIKEQSGVKWLQSQIRSKLQYAKKKYDMAGELGESHASMRDTDTAKLRRRMLELCPYYERFYAVYGGTPLPSATAPVHSSAIFSSTSSSGAAAAAAKAPYQFSTYSQVNGVGYTSPHESRHPRTSTLVRNPSPSPMDHGSSSGRYEREEEEEVEEEEAIDNYHQEYQSPLAGRDARDEEEEVRDQSPEEEAVREPSEATYEMVSQQDMMSDHGHGSDYGAAPEIDSYRERSVALRTADKGKGSSKRHRTQWGGRYSHHDHDDRDTFMDDFKTVDSAAAGRIVWIEQDKERMRQLIRKEQMLEERESSWALRMLQQQEQHQAMLLKREEEAELRLKRRFEELEEERQQVRAMQQELAAREKEFYKERESWLAGYAVVKADAAKAAALYHAQN